MRPSSASQVGRAMSTVSSVFDLEGDLDGGDGLEEGGTTLQASLAASRRAETKSTQELQLELEAVRLRLLRRSQIIDVIRSAYVRDVVMVKNELMRKASMPDEEYIAQGGPGTEITDAIPSLDMRPVLALFSPEDAFLRVESCTACGGHLEIVTKETKRVARLTKRISDMNEQMGETAKEAAHLRAELILTRHRVNELDERNTVNRDTLVAKLEMTQKTCESDVQVLKEDARRSDRAWEARLARKDEQLAVIPVLHEERDMLREALSDERTSREEDLHHRDSEIATLKAKVADLESSAEAEVKVLLEARTKADEVKRRLKAEKEGHAATAALLEEERAKYERCRSRLETSQEHLADLNDRFNELRADVECSAENAQDEAGEASDALAAAKMEIQRLRGLLGTNDAAKALETATLKVSSLSEELHAARSDAIEAKDALREGQEQLHAAQAELDTTTALRQSIATRASDGGLSWTGPFPKPLANDGSEERQDPTPSSAVPGNGSVGNGTSVDSEKWISLVRYRRAVNAHATEVARLQTLLVLAQGGEERSRLTAELEQASNMIGLEGMENAMHVEVADLKMKAAGYVDDGEKEERARANTAAADEAAWKAKLAESAAAQRVAFHQKLADMEALHEVAIEAVRAKLNEEKQKTDRLEADAVETRERLKKLDKYEKNEKGHNAMTEELKKMEKETGLSVGLEASLEFASVDGDLSKEDEERLMEELDNAREEIKNIKMRQAMVTHELLGTIKGANAEVDMLKAALADMTAQRDARVDMSTLAGMGSGLSGSEADEYQTLKEDAKRQKTKMTALKAELDESSEALMTLLEALRKSCKGTSRAKAKVWNLRDLERARSIPPLPKNSMVAGGNGGAAGIDRSGKNSVTVKRLSTARSSGGSGGSARMVSSVGIAVKNARKPGKDEQAGSRTGTVGAVAVGGAVVDEGGRGGDGGGSGRGGGGGGGGGGSTEGGGANAAATADEEKEAELEKRRRDRAEQALEKKKLAEAEQRELEEFKEACLLLRSEGVSYAVEKLEALQAEVKCQFREVFVELKETLEMHKKFVMRSRVEAREVTGKMATLQTELERLRELHTSTEEQLRGRSAVLNQTQQELTAEKSAGAATRRELAASQAEARDNIFFKEKNARLQKQLDHLDIASRRAKQECEKAKRELREQGVNLIELRKLAEEAERRGKAFETKEKSLESKVETLATLLEEAESKIESLEHPGKFGLEAATSIATQVNGYSDPDLCLAVQGSTQTEFHCPRMTLRRSNNQGTFPSQALTVGSAGDGSSPPFREGVGTGALGVGRSWRGAVGLVCPAVDGRAVAAERDLYSPGVGSTAFFEIQGPGAVHSVGSAMHHLDTYSDSLNQLSYGSPAWAMGATERSFYGSSEGAHVVERGPESRNDNPDIIIAPPQPQQQRQVESGGGQAKNWGLWHEGDGEGSTDEGTGEATGPELQPDNRTAVMVTAPGAAPGARGRDGQRPGTISECRTKADTPEAIDHDHGRPQTSPTAVHLRGPQGINDEVGAREACRSPPQRMHSRLFVQSAMDLSLSPAGGRGSGRWGGGQQQPRRQGVASASETTRQAVQLNGASWSSLPASAAAGGGNARRVAGERPSTSSAALTNNKSMHVGGGGEVLPSRGGGIDAVGGNERQVIDLGVVSDAVPRPIVWGEQQMAAAAGAAMGRSTSARTGKGPRGWAGVTQGGVVLDARFAKVRRTLRRDVLDMAERARLPLLQ